MKSYLLLSAYFLLNPILVNNKSLKFIAKFFGLLLSINKTDFHINLKLLFAPPLCAT